MGSVKPEGTAPVFRRFLEFRVRGKQGQCVTEQTKKQKNGKKKKQDSYDFLGETIPTLRFLAWRHKNRS